MPEKPLRIVLVGAGSLLGKALNDELAASVFSSADFHLLDEDETSGRLSTAADEVSLIQRIEPDSFDNCDFTFFAGGREQTKKHWRNALKAGSRIVDLSGELEGAPGTLVRAPWIQEETVVSDASDSQAMMQSAAPDLQTRIVVSAHPVAVLLGLLAIRSQRIAPVRVVWATLLQPASEYGHAALEELHQQTANLLSFQPLPMEVFGAQTAFSLVVSFGAEGRIALASAAEDIRRQYAKIVPATANALALQVIQVPVFHGYSVSIALEFAQPIAADGLARALAGPHVHIVPRASEFPGNVQAVEEEEIQILVRPVLRIGAIAGKTAAGTRTTDRFWVWSVADNLKLAAQNAIACAVELNRLRPRGTVQ
ncbi:MAG: Asd/ArgC dimerization domain-containing protein [Acidobacteriaceae bacterium]